MAVTIRSAWRFMAAGLVAAALYASRASAQTRPVDLSGARDSTLSDTAFARIWTASCERAVPRDSGLVYGIVRDARTMDPVGGASIDLVWTQLIVDDRKTVHERRIRVDTKANADGVFGMCGIPTQQFVRIGAGYQGRVSALIDLPPGERRVMRRDLLLGAEADSGERGVIIGTLRDVAGAPLGNARIIVDGSVEVRAAADGHFRVSGVATGTRQIEVLSVGMVPVVAAVDVFPNDSTPVVLTVRRVTALDAVRVTASQRARGVIDGIEERKRLGTGYLIEAGELYAHADLAMVFREFPNAEVERTHGDIVVRTQVGRGRICEPEVWVDGNHSAQTILSSLRMSEIVAVEFYPRAETVPVQFLSSSVARACGAILIWTTWLFGR
jgi:hypothetical protein